MRLRVHSSNLPDFRQKAASLNPNKENPGKKQIPPTPATAKIFPKQSPNRIQRATMPNRRREKINDLNLEQWRQYDNLLTDSIWIQNRRDSGGAHQAGYHGNFIPQIPNSCSAASPSPAKSSSTPSPAAAPPPSKPPAWAVGTSASNSPPKPPNKPAGAPSGTPPQSSPATAPPRKPQRSSPASCPE